MNWEIPLLYVNTLLFERLHQNLSNEKAVDLCGFGITQPQFSINSAESVLFDNIMFLRRNIFHSEFYWWYSWANVIEISFEKTKLKRLSCLYSPTLPYILIFHKQWHLYIWKFLWHSFQNIQQFCCSKFCWISLIFEPILDDLSKTFQETVKIHEHDSHFPVNLLY